MSDDGSKLSALRGFGSLIRSIRRDGWENAITGLGTTRDKTTYGSYKRSVRISDMELRDLYHHHDLTKRIIDIRPKAMFREGFRVEIKDDTDAAKDVNQEIQKRGIRGLFVRGMIWGSLYGGCLLIAGIDDGKDMSEPLDPDAPIRTIRYFLLLDKRYLTPNSWYEDPEAEKYQEVETYRVMTPTGVLLESVIHESRCIRFGGALTDDQERKQNNGWDYSQLQHIYDACRDGEANWKATNHLLSDASQAVFKIKGFINALATPGGSATMQTRMELLDMARSVARSVILDADHNESFERVATSFAGVADVLDRSMMRTASAARIPVTILYGRSAAGMNATGDGDFRAFYDDLKGERTQEVDPDLRKVMEWIMRAADGPTQGNVPEEWEICYPKLWQSTPLEAAQISKLVAETDKIRIDSQVWTPEEVALSRARGGDESPVEIDEELRELNQKNEKELAKNGPPTIDPLTGLPAAGVPGTPPVLPGGRPNAPPGEDPPGDPTEEDPSDRPPPSA